MNGLGQTPLAQLLRSARHRSRITHVERRAAQESTSADWPTWAPAELVEAFQAIGVRLGSGPTLDGAFSLVEARRHYGPLVRAGFLG